ncbi:MAG: hypothetical protein AAGA55_00960 [Planctomycetota bacterium]
MRHSMYIATLLAAAGSAANAGAAPGWLMIAGSATMPGPTTTASKPFETTRAAEPSNAGFPRLGCGTSGSCTSVRRSFGTSWGPLGTSQPASGTVVTFAIAYAQEFGTTSEICDPCPRRPLIVGVAGDAGSDSTPNVQIDGAASSSSASNPGNCSSLGFCADGDGSASAEIFVGGGGEIDVDASICIGTESGYEVCPNPDPNDPNTNIATPVSALRLNMGSGGGGAIIRLLPGADTRMSVTLTEDIDPGGSGSSLPGNFVDPADPVAVVTYTESIRDAATLADHDVEQGVYILLNDGTTITYGGYNAGFTQGPGPYADVTGSKTIVLDAGTTTAESEYFSDSDSFVPGTLDLNRDEVIDCMDRDEIVALAAAGITFPDSRYNARADFDLDLDIDSNDVWLFKQALYSGFDTAFGATGSINPVCFIADTNCDGSVTPGDFNGWILEFNAMSPFADANNNGILDPGDFNAWLLNFNQAGSQCP